MGQPTEIVAPLQAFEDNLRSVVRVLTLPFQLSGAAVQQRRLDQLYRAELIRSLDLDDSSRDNSPETNAAAMAKALSTFRAELETEEGIRGFRKQAKIDLSGRLHIAEITTASADLLRQATSMTWTAFEVLFRDSVTTALNTNPTLVPVLLRDDRARQVLDLKRIDTEVIVGHGFDLKQRMGNIIGSHGALTRLDTMKITLRAMCPTKPAVARMLDDRQLWLLARQRHLIVHRRGIVDSLYVENTGDNRPIGSLLTLAPSEVVQQVLLVQGVGLAITRALGELVETGGMADSKAGGESREIRGDAEQLREPGGPAGGDDS